MVIWAGVTPLASRPASSSFGTSSGLRPRVVVALYDVVVEPGLGGDLRDLGDVLVAPVAGHGERDQPAAAHGRALDQLAHGPHRGGVVAVVEDDLERVLAEHVHPAGRLEERGVEGAQPVADVLELLAQAVGDGGGDHGVLHVVQRPASMVAGIRWVQSSGMWRPLS